MAKKNKPREKNERDLLEDIKSLLVLIASKSGSNSEQIGKVLGVKGSRIRNILTGVGKNKKNSKESQEQEE